MMARLIMLAVLAAVTGCQSTQPPGFIARRSKGQSAESIAAAAASCRNEARAILGVNRNAWFWPTYSDCMVGKGYELDVGQTE
jgi:hypothetical protein